MKFADTSIQMTASGFRRVLGLGDGDETFPEFIARRIRVAELARSVLNHVITMDTVAQVLPDESGRKLVSVTSKNVEEMIRGWCGNEPIVIRFPFPWPWPPEPDPGPDWIKFKESDFAVLGSELISGAGLIQNELLQKTVLAGAQATFEQAGMRMG
jgi:hypothetical protein